MLLPNPSPFLEQFLLTKLSQREVKDWLQTYARPYRELMSCYRLPTYGKEGQSVKV